MSNYEFKLLIRQTDIHNKIHPKQKEKISEVKITKATVMDNGDVEINCLAVTDEIKSYPNRQILLDSYDYFLINEV